MRDIAIYGAGGFGREAAWMVQEINQARDQWNLVGFFDDGHKTGNLIDGLPVLGGLREVNSYGQAIDLVIAIANPAVRKDLVSKITNKHIGFPTLIHPTVLTGAPVNRFGRGSILTAGVILTTGIDLGEFVIVNLAATVGHDAKLGAFVSIMPQCSISGSVTIGEGSLIGSGARILQGINLGKSCVVGAGAVVTKSFPDSSRLIGIPARHVLKAT